MPTRIIIRKAWNARDERNSWVNNYEFQGSEPPTAAIWDTVVGNLVDAEKAIHFNFVEFLTATVSTWEPDSKPYNPASFRSIPLTGTGSRVLTNITDALDSNVCYFVRKQVASGRQGRIFYRGCLAEVDVQGRADLAFELATASALATGGTLFTAYRNEMLTMIGDAVDVGAGQLSLIATYGDAPAVHMRPVVDVKVGGVVINRRNHRYFDRA